MSAGWVPLRSVSKHLSQASALASGGLLAIFGVSWLRSHSEVVEVRTSAYEFEVG